MSRSLFFLVVLSVVAYSAAQDVLMPMEADSGVPINPAIPTLVADDSAATAEAGRPKRQFGLGFLLGSALGGGYGYGRPYGYGGYGGYGRPHGYGGYGYGHHHHGHRYGGYGYGR